MSNGFSGSKTDFEKLEEPLRKLDTGILNFAEQHGMKLSKNYHNWPERSLTWITENRKLIQIFLVDEKRGTYNLWLCATKDVGRERLWKQMYLLKDEPLFKLEGNLQDYLSKALEIVSAWKDKDLVPSNVKME